MRRLIAFIVDIALAVPLVTGALGALSFLFSRELLTTPLILFASACTMAAFECFYLGITPGKFLVRLRVIRLSGDGPPDLFQLYVRSTMIFVLPLLLGTAIDFLAEWVLHVRSFTFVATLAGVFALFIPPLLLTFGNQSIHDFFAGTAVVSRQTLHARRVLTQNVIAIIAVSAISFAAATVYYFNIDAARSRSPARTVTAVLESEMQSMVTTIPKEAYLESRDLEAGIDDFKNFGPFLVVTPISLGDLIEKEKNLDDEVLKNIGPDETVARIVVQVTLNGLLMQRPQEILAANAIHTYVKRRFARICVVEYHYSASIPLLSFEAVRPILVYMIPYQIPYQLAFATADVPVTRSLRESVEFGFGIAMAGYVTGPGPRSHYLYPRVGL